MMMDPRKISSVYLTRTAELIGISEPATKISKTSLKFRAQESSTSRDKKTTNWSPTIPKSSSSPPTSLGIRREDVRSTSRESASTFVLPKDCLEHHRSQVEFPQCHRDMPPQNVPNTSLHRFQSRYHKISRCGCLNGKTCAPQTTSNNTSQDTIAHSTKRCGCIYIYI